MDAFMRSSSIITSFESAIDSGLHAIRNDGGRQVTLSERRSLGSDRSGVFYYSFRAHQDVGLPDDSPIEVHVGNHSVSGTLVRVNGFRVLIALEARLPKSKGVQET